MLDVSNWFHIAGALQGPAPLEESSTVPPRSAWLLSWWWQTISISNGWFHHYSTPFPKKYHCSRLGLWSTGQAKHNWSRLKSPGLWPWSKFNLFMLSNYWTSGKPWQNSSHLSQPKLNRPSLQVLFQHIQGVRFAGRQEAISGCHLTEIGKSPPWPRHGNAQNTWPFWRASPLPGVASNQFHGKHWQTGTKLTKPDWNKGVGSWFMVHPVIELKF